MGNIFYAIFGTCRRRGGTKKKCYVKAIETIGKTVKRKRKPKKSKAIKRKRK